MPEAQSLVSDARISFSDVHALVSDTRFFVYDAQVLVSDTLFSDARIVYDARFATLVECWAP